MSDPTTHRSSLATARFAAVGVTVLALAAGFASGRATVAASTPLAPTVAVTSPAPPPVQAMPGTYSAVVDRVAPAVVTVRVDKRAQASQTGFVDPFGELFGQRRNPRGESQRGLGSGVVIRADGYLLTNHHVIDGADKIRVEMADGRSLAATLVGSDPASDLAVLKVAATGLPAVAFGDSDRVRVGDVVLAFGNPLGVGQTVTMGIVSAKGRATGVGDGSYEDFLQTDAPINQGNSGGALVDVHGALIGINAQILSRSGGNIGLGFAIPSGMARAVSDQLIEGGVVHRSKLGVTVQALTPELAESLGVSDARGALVSGVEPNGPADRAGLRAGDVVTAFDGRPAIDSNALRNQIASAKPGSAVAITVLRDGATQTLSATLVEREAAAEAGRRAKGDAPDAEGGLGLTLTPLTPDIAAQLELPRGEKGLVVTEVEPGSVAATAGFQAGDVIARVNGRDVATGAALRESLAARRDRPALVLVRRQGASVFVAVPQARS